MSGLKLRKSFCLVATAALLLVASLTVAQEKADRFTPKKGIWTATGDDSACDSARVCIEWDEEDSFGNLVPTGIMCCGSPKSVGSTQFGGACDFTRPL